MYDLDDPIYQTGYKASRDPVDRITDEMLTRPLWKLTPAEFGMIKRAVAGARSEELMARIEALHRPKRNMSQSSDLIV